MSEIKELFQQSPFEPLRVHLAKVMECVGKVKPMFEALRDGKFDDLERLADSVFKIEHQADKIKTEIRRHIPRTFFMPVYRGDLLGHLKLQDDIADAVEDLAFLLTIKKLSWPEVLHEPVFGYIDKVLCTCEKLQALGDYLPVLVEKDFDPEGSEKALDLVAAIERAEWEADRLSYALAKELFAQEEIMRTTDIFLWSKISGELGQLANHAEKTGDRLRRMLTAHL